MRLFTTVLVACSLVVTVLGGAAVAAQDKKSKTPHVKDLPPSVPQIEADAQRPNQPPLDGHAILERLDQENLARDGRLDSYTSTRRYSVHHGDHENVSELVVALHFVAPSTYNFSTTSNQGVGWIHRRVFGGLMEAEQAASRAERSVSAISSDNYDAQFIRSEEHHGRDCYVVALQPKHSGKYLFKGYAWIDQADFAIARLEGEPAQSPSVWVVRAPFVREFERVDGFWFPNQDETHSRIRLAGEYVLRIQYGDYHVNARADH